MSEAKRFNLGEDEKPGVGVHPVPGEPEAGLFVVGDGDFSLYMSDLPEVQPDDSWFPQEVIDAITTAVGKADEAGQDPVNAYRSFTNTARYALLEPKSLRKDQIEEAIRRVQAQLAHRLSH